MQNHGTDPIHDPNGQVDEELICRLAEMISSSERCVVLTGAGISTESGLPDFRSGDDGLWQKVDPIRCLSTHALYWYPELFYKVGMKILDRFTKAEPNQAHFALAELEKRGFIKAVITQNIDGLHQRAGSKKVIEIHGNLRVARCDKCESAISFRDLVKRSEEGPIPPRCECDGIIRPEVVLFGDPMPPCFEEAWQLAEASDLLLVIGSSLEVAPASYLPGLSQKTAIINLSPTPHDGKASIIIRGRAGYVLNQTNLLLNL